MVDAKSLLLIGLSEKESNEETIREAYEDKVFELSNFFMLRAFVPKLAIAKIRRLQELRPIGDALKKTTARESDRIAMEFRHQNNERSLKDCIKSYHEVESKIKQGLASATAAHQSEMLYKIWIEVFNAYAKRFVLIYESEIYAEPADEAVKLTDQIDITALLAELTDYSSQKPLINRAYSRLKKMTI
jgi:hypothetical protein